MFKLVKQEKMCTRGQGGGRSWIQLSLPCSRLVVVAHTPRLYPISIVYSKLSLSLFTGLCNNISSPTIFFGLFWLMKLIKKQSESINITRDSAKNKKGPRPAGAL